MASRFVKQLLASVLAWVLLAVVAGPYLVRQAYRGESFSFVNDVFAGRDIHPLAFYMEAWWTLVVVASLVLAGLLGAAYLTIRFSGLRRNAIRRMLGGDGPLATSTLLWYGLLIGSAGGMVEASYRAIRQMVTQRPEAGFFWELMWMAPLSAGVAAVVVAGFLALVAKAGGIRVGAVPATWVLSGLAIYGVVQTEGIPIHPIAEVVLSLGLAAAVGRLVAPRASTVPSGILRSRPYFAGTFAFLLAFAVVRMPAVAERRASADLPPAEPGRTNVLLIIWDTVRAANLSLYGYQRETSPTLDEWAQSGAVYERAFATASWTLPSHVSILTGRFPFETETGVAEPLGKTVPTLAEVLGEQGYATAGFVANVGYTSPMSGLHRGFARYQAHRITPAQVVWSSWLSATLAAPVQRLTGLLSSGKIGRHVTAEFVDWLDDKDERPFFAFLNYFDAHDPYAAPMPYRRMFGPGAEGSWGDVAAQWDRAFLDGSPRPDVSGWMDRYDGGIAYLDYQLGLIRDALADRGLLENTIVIVTSDHGEHWGEHGFIEHGNSLYTPLVHVPLVVLSPQLVQPDQRIDEPVTLRDVPMTILGLLGLAEGASIPGRPMQTIVLHAPERPPSPVLAELDAPVLGPMRGLEDPSTSRAATESLVDGRFHYILNSDGSEELYDIQRDAAENENLSASAEMDPVLEAFRTTLTALAVGRPPLP